ncbi:MAG: hypothetical protein ACU833_11365 [Gammaproteobacteria bacterium]
MDINARVYNPEPNRPQTRYAKIIKSWMLNSLAFLSGCVYIANDHTLNMPVSIRQIDRELKSTCLMTGEFSDQLINSSNCTLLTCTLSELEKLGVFSSIKPAGGVCPVTIIITKKTTTEIENLVLLPISLIKISLTLGSLGIIPLPYSQTEHYRFAVLIEGEKTGEFIYTDRLRKFIWLFNKEYQKAEEESLHIVLNNFVEDLLAAENFPFDVERLEVFK